MNYRRFALALGLVFCFKGRGMAQEIKLAPTFGSDYRNARKWVENNKWIADSLNIYGVPPAEALPIVFPELIRYSAVWDRMEVTGLIVLYIRFGNAYADFSVGHFQMKPSFVVELEKEAPQYLTPKEIGLMCPELQHGEDTNGARAKRVNDLTYTLSETRYLALFYKICLAKFSELEQASSSDRLRFLATAYNCGFQWPKGYISQQMSKKHFPLSNGWFHGTCNYASVSLAWWKESIH